MGACQSQSGDAQLSQWAVAEWAMQHSLDPEGPDIDSLRPYLTTKAIQEIRSFKQVLKPEKGLGLLTLNHTQGQRWVGRYAYSKHTWPMALNIEMTHAKGFWQINSFPFIKMYTHFADILKKGGIPQIQQGEIWHGGLISYDLSGRPQAEVVLTWLPPFVFIDGVPLQGKATEKKVLSAIQNAFALRSDMAEKVQASYLKRLILCLPSQSTFKELTQLMTWGEQVGTDIISLLGHNQQSEAVMIRLAKRVAQVTLLKPQKIAYSEISDHKLTLSLGISQHTSSQPVQWPIHPIQQMIKENKEVHTKTIKLLNDQQESKAFEILTQMKNQNSLAGIYITAQADSTYADVLAWIDQLKTLDPKLAITLGPPILSESKE